MRCSRPCLWLALLLFVAPALLLPASAAADTGSRALARVAKAKVEIPLPAEGEVAFATFELRATPKGAKNVKARKLRLLNADELPEDVSIVGAVKKIKGEKNRFRAAVALLNPEDSPAARPLAGDDLEERVAELEATTVRKGNRRVSLRIVGWVNAPNVLDPGAELGSGACNQIRSQQLWTSAARLADAVDIVPSEALRLTAGAACSFATKDEVDQLTYLVQRPRATNCAGSIRLFNPTTPNEVVVSFECLSLASDDVWRPAPARGPAGAAATATRFDVQIPGNRVISNWLSPPGFTCLPRTRTTANDTLSCLGTFGVGETIEANIRAQPNFAGGVGASLYVFVDGVEQGPFAITGP